MITGLKEWIVQKLLGTYLKDLLDLLPANNRKTIVSVILTAVTILLFSFTGTDYSILRVLTFLASILPGIGGESLMTQGDIALAVESFATLLFLFHKLLKRIGGGSDRDNYVEDYR